MTRTLERRDPGATLAWLLAITVHVALFTILVFGIQWRTKRADPVMAELWTQLPVVAPPPPVVQPKPPPKPEPKLEPKPEPKPEPKVEAKPPPKPDIALEEERKRKEDAARKLREEAERKKQEELRARQEREREAAEKRQIEEETRKRMQDQLNRELASAPKAPGPPLLGDPKARALWADRIRAKIRSNIVLPPDLTGNPEAVFDVELLPTGEVLAAKLRKSSGSRTYDEAVERAILKSSPLPLPERREVFESRLELRFRPKD